MSKKFDGAEKGWMTVDVRDGLIVMKLKDATELYDRITASSANCSSSPEGVRLFTGSYQHLNYSPYHASHQEAALLARTSVADGWASIRLTPTTLEAWIRRCFVASTANSLTVPRK